MKLDRREFLKSAALLSAYGMLPSGVFGLAREAQALEACEQGRFLVIVQLEGGNDGQNMVIPAGGPNRGHYLAHRPVLGIQDADLVATTLATDAAGNDIALHPHMIGLKQLFSEGKLAVLQQVEYENGSLSHFDSENIWYSGNPAFVGVPSGWMGRAIENLCSGGGISLPGLDTQEELTPLFLGSGRVLTVSPDQDFFFPTVYQLYDPAMQSDFRTAMDTLYQEAAAGSGWPSVYGGSGFAFFSRLDTLAQIDRDIALNLNDLIQGTANGGGGFGQFDPFNGDGFGLARALRFVFSVMRGGPPGTPIGPRIFRVRIGGFDTHSRQGVHVPLSTMSLPAKVQNGFPNEDHGKLLHRVDAALSAFWRDCEEQGLAGSTSLMVFSEFGRRIEENRSDNRAGTDHGTLAPMFAIGPTAAQTGGVHLSGGLFGVHPSIAPADLNGDGNTVFDPLGASIDYRRVYAEFLTNWLGLPAGTTSSLLFGFSGPSVGFLA